MFIQFEIIINILALSASFIYLYMYVMGLRTLSFVYFFQLGSTLHVTI